jgi:hypothetical protein
MSDRKYRQRGYQDEPRSREPRGEKPAAPPKERAPGGRPLQDAAGPRTPNLMASHEVFRCARCGNLLTLDVGPTAGCSKCGVDLHACIQCASFDTSARWECTQNAKLPARVAPKDERNLCVFFTPRTTIERQTSSPTVHQESSPGSSSARKAFDDLFK